MKISFCTSCLNRFHQFIQTFHSNLAIISQRADVEWVIINMNSNDGLHEFIVERLPSLPVNVIYGIERRSRPWHMSVAKNIAHRVGSGDILVNLDCDNYIYNTLDLIQGPLDRGVKLVHLWSGVCRDGTCGRIAISRELFYKLGGYDESLHPVGFEEIDLIKRAKRTGIIIAHCPCQQRSAIENEKSESIKYCHLEKGMTWDLSMEKNRQRSKRNIKMNKTAANQGRNWGHAELELFHGKCSDFQKKLFAKIDKI